MYVIYRIIVRYCCGIVSGIIELKYDILVLISIYASEKVNEIKHIMTYFFAR